MRSQNIKITLIALYSLGSFNRVPFTHHAPTNCNKNNLSCYVFQDLSVEYPYLGSENEWFIGLKDKVASLLPNRPRTHGMNRMLINSLIISEPL